MVKLEDSAAGTFTASYNADGSLTERGLPDGLTAKTTYNEAGEPTNLSYTKASSCGASCTWLEEGLERSINGQILAQTSTLSSQLYSYDKAGRLVNVNDTASKGRRNYCISVRQSTAASTRKREPSGLESHDYG